MKDKAPKMQDLINALDFINSLKPVDESWAEDNKLITRELLDEKLPTEKKANQYWLDLMSD